MANPDSDARRPSFADLVNKALQTNPEAALRNEGEDPDDWLDVDPVALDHALKQYHQQKEGHVHGHPKDSNNVNDQGDDEDMVANEQAARLKELAERTRDFVEGEGALEGALFDE